MRRSVVVASVVAGALVLAGISGCGPEKYVPKTGGSEEYQKKVQQGQPMYTPPAGAMPPGIPKR